MTSAREQELYHEARNRTLVRMVEGKQFTDETTAAFRIGVSYADNLYEGVLTVEPESNNSFAVICGFLAKLEAVKGKSYEASWMRRGDAGVLANIARKFDIIESSMNGNKIGENRCTNLADLAVYCIKELTRQAQLNPEEFGDWVREVRSLG